MASSGSPEDVIARMARLLEAAGVPYMLTGSFASGYHGTPRASHDIDIVVAPNLDSLEHLLRLLPVDQYHVSRDAAFEAYGAETLFNVIELESAWKIDLIMLKSRAFSRTEFDRRVRVEFAGTELYVATAEDVLLAKLEWAKLCRSERQLEDAAGILRVQGEALDLEHVDRWARALELSTELAAARARAEPVP